MPSRIERLPAETIAGIAAGEVVERPASVVKELLENSVDAGATRVQVAYNDNGARRIEVSDNGCGIPAAEVGLAFERHATSKLRGLAGLATVSTFGFRGEALASIVAVSGVELLTRAGSEEAGTRIAAGPGGVSRPSVAGSPAGTRIVVEDLFAETPARRKFLRSKNAEYGHVADIVRRFALLRPSLHLELAHNGRRSLELPAVADLGQRLEQVWGREGPVIEISARHGAMKLSGLVSQAGRGNATARKIAMFVNRRWVRDRFLFRALMEACVGHMVKGRYPTCCLFIEVEPASVDFNVHPAKLEVRFTEPASVGRFVTEALAQALRSGTAPLLRPDRARDRQGYREIEGGALRVQEAGPAGYRTATVEPLPAGEATGRAAEPLPGIVAACSTVGGLEVVGQVFDGYLVCQAPEELLLVDQHALHERIIFERLMSAYQEANVESQPLLVPVTVSVGAGGVEAVERHGAALAGSGWELEPFGTEDILVRAVPALLAGTDTTSMVERAVSDLAVLDTAAPMSTAVSTTMASAACHAAVRVGRRMGRPEARALLQEAASVEYSATCPHGRPVAKRFGRVEVERMFGR